MTNKENLEYYEVGGAVRDRLLGIEPTDYDYVVVGATPEEMKVRGFLPVQSASFPVFIDKDEADEGELGDEYALARTERRKNVNEEDNAYVAFDWDTENVSLEEDLRRRDLTINAMARNPQTGEILDPYGGQEDLEDEVIRHVSEAFSEDPLRVIRMARFAARFDFEVHEETMEMAQSVAPQISGIDDQRLIREFQKAMKQADKPGKFFRVCREADVFNHFLPIVERMAEIPAGSPKYHGEGSVFNHSVMVVNELHKIRGNNPNELLGAFFHDVGKVITYDEEEPYKHYEHAKKGSEFISSILGNRDNVETDIIRTLEVACKEHMNVKRIPEMQDSTIINFVNDHYNNRDPERLNFLLALGLADARGREPSSEFKIEDAREIVKTAQQAIDYIDGDHLEEEHGEEFYEWEGEKIGRIVNMHRIEKFRDLR